MNKILILGAGWRAEFYIRIALALPTQFQIAGIYCRREERSRELSELFHNRVPIFTDLAKMLETVECDFAITAVSWEANWEMMEALANKNIPILTETPPGPDLKGLHKVWELHEKGARIRVAEQFIYQPHHAARLNVCREGILGRVNHVGLSVCHGYHAVSLMRNYLDVNFREVEISGHEWQQKSIKGPGRNSVDEKEPSASSRLKCFFDYQDGLTSEIDFNSAQYFSYIRSQRILIQGERGEITEDGVRYLNPEGEPLEFELSRRQGGLRGNLEGLHLRNINGGGTVYYRNPFDRIMVSPLDDEELAMATVMAGRNTYPLAQACEDHYYFLKMQESASTHTTVRTERQPWWP